MTSVTFNLSSPIEHNGQAYTTLTFNEATAGDLAAADVVKGETTKTLAIFASMSETPIQVMRKIKARDLGRLAVEVAPLLGESGEQAKDGEA